MVMTELNVIKQHPVMRVGKNLNGGYMLDSLPDFAYQNGEVKVWIQGAVNQDKRTYLIKDIFPDLNIYTALGVSLSLIHI